MAAKQTLVPLKQEEIATLSILKNVHIKKDAMYGQNQQWLWEGCSSIKTEQKVYLVPIVFNRTPIKSQEEMLPTQKYEENRTERILLFVQSQNRSLKHQRSEEALETKQDHVLRHSSL